MRIESNTMKGSEDKSSGVESSPQPEVTDSLIALAETVN